MPKLNKAIYWIFLKMLDPIIGSIYWVQLFFRFGMPNMKSYAGIISRIIQDFKSSAPILRGLSQKNLQTQFLGIWEMGPFSQIPKLRGNNFGFSSQNEAIWLEKRPLPEHCEHSLYVSKLEL